jgi:hypothetical protein
VFGADQFYPTVRSKDRELGVDQRESLTTMKKYLLRKKAG